MVVSRARAVHFAQYLTAGGLSFASEYATFLTLYYAVGFPVVAANAGGFALSLVVNFSLNRWWVFRNGLRAGRQQLALFVALASFNLGVTTLTLLIMKYHGFNLAVGKLLIMSVIVLWNFAIMRNIIFKRSQG